LEELRSVISTLSKKKQISISYAPSCNEKQYILASAFKHVSLHPIGHLNRFDGTTTKLFFKRFLQEYFGFVITKTQLHEYKEFADFAARDTISNSVKENHLSVLQSIYDTFFQSIYEDRKQTLTSEKSVLPRVLFEGPYTAENAHSLGLIDSLQYPFDVLEKAKSDFKTSNNIEVQIMDVDNYVRVFKRYQKKLFKNRKREQAKQRVKSHDVECISVVQIGGKITSGSRQKFIQQLDRINKDHNITSVILRVDSPGGDAIDSNTLSAFIDRLRSEGKKKVVISMGNVAASGGYYVSLSGDHIFAHKSTITGSIGVVSLHPHFDQRFLNKIGVTTQVLKVEGADETQTLFNAKQNPKMEKYIEYVYDDFLKRVSERRELQMDQVDQLARGRIFSGQQAYENGLVDDLGGLLEAIDYARTDRNSGIMKPYVISFYEEPIQDAIKAYIWDNANPLQSLGITKENIETTQELQDSKCLLLYVPEF
jgi:protease-4